MMILNLFIGVITSSMADAKSDLSAELENEAASRLDAPEEIVRIMGLSIASPLRPARSRCLVWCTAVGAPP